jgi:hypothetical protein
VTDEQVPDPLYRLGAGGAHVDQRHAVRAERTRTVLARGVVAHALTSFLEWSATCQTDDSPQEFAFRCTFTRSWEAHSIRLTFAGQSHDAGPALTRAATVLVTAYVLVARHGLRLPTATRATEESTQRRLPTAQGNTAWRCLPDLHRSANTEQVRAMNAAARLLLIHPDDQEADTVLRTNSQTLHQLTLTQHEAPAPREGTSTA